MPARDRRRPFWSKWVWKDWDGKTKDLSPHEYTAYHRLLSYCATQSDDMCSMPDDEVRLARATGMGLKVWRKVSRRVLDYFRKVDSRWVHDRLLEDASRFSQARVNTQSRVNETCHTDVTDGRHARGGQKLEVRSKKEEESTPPPQSLRASPPSGRTPIEGSPVLPTNTNGGWQATQEEVDAWSEAYPGLNVLGTILEMRAWLVANPTKRKTFNGMSRFVNGWLAREQNRL